MGKDKGERRQKKSEKSRRASRLPLWIALGAGGTAVVILVITLVIVLSRPGEAPTKAPAVPVAVAPSSSTPPPGPGQANPIQANAALPQPASSAPMNVPPGPPAQTAAPMPLVPEGPPLTEEEKRLRALFKVQLALHGPARFEHAQYKDKSYTGVVVEIEGQTPEALGKFEAATATARTAAGADIRAAILFTAAGRDGLAPTAKTLPGAIGKRGDIVIGKQRFQPWPVGPFGQAASEVNSAGADTVRVHVPPGAMDFRVGDFLVAMPIILEAGGGVEYGFVPGKKVSLGFLFPAGTEELTRVKLFGYDLPLDPAKQADKATVVQGPGNAPAPIAPAAAPNARTVPVTLLKPQTSFDLGPGSVPLVTFSGDGQRALAVHRPLPPDRPPPTGVTIVAGDSIAAWDLQTGKPLPLAPKDFTFDVKIGSAQFAAAGFLEKDRQAFGVLTSGDTLIYEVGAGKKPQVSKLPAHGLLAGESAVAFDGRHLVLPDSINGLHFVEIASRKILASFIGHAQPANAVVLLPDGKRLLSAGQDGSVRLWDVKTGKELRRLDREIVERQPYVTHLAALLDNKQALFFWSDGSVQLWDVDEWQEAKRWNLPAHLTPAGDGQMRVGGPVQLAAVAVAPGEARRVLLACQDATIRLWDLDKDREMIFGLGRAPSNPASSPAFAPPFSQPLFGQPARPQGPPMPLSLAVAPDGRRFLSGESDGQARLWQIPGDGAMAMTPLRAEPYPAYPRKDIEPIRRLHVSLNPMSGGIAFSADVKQAVTISRWWKNDDADELPSKSTKPPPKTAPKQPGFPGFTPNLFASREESIVRVWNLDPPGEVRRLKPVLGELSSIAFSPNGKQAVTAAGSPGIGGDGFIRRWDLQTGKQISQWNANAAVGSLAFSPDGKRVASGGAGPAGGGIVQGDAQFAVLIWEVGTGSSTRCIGHTSAVNSVAFSPKGNQLVSAGGKFMGGQAVDGSIRIWDMKGKQTIQLPGHAGGTHQAVFSPDGAQILSGGEDNKVRLWDAKTGKQIAELAGHGKAVMAVAFSPDGKRALSAGKYENVILWDLEARKVLARIPMPGGRAVAFGGDGHQVLAADDSEIRVFQVKE